MSETPKNHSPEADFVFDEFELSESDIEIASLEGLERELDAISEEKNEAELPILDLEESLDELFIEEKSVSSSSSNETNPLLANLGEEASIIASLLQASLESLENLEMLLNQDDREQQVDMPTIEDSLSQSDSASDQEIQTKEPQSTPFNEESFDLSFTKEVENLTLSNVTTKPPETENNFWEVVDGENSVEEAFPQNPDWFVIARKLRQENRDLRKNVGQLKHSLAESQERLQSQVMRSRSADLLIAQQTEELNLSQEKIHRLVGELDAAHQVNQHQQKLIENFSTELESDRQQVALLERECALLQESYNDKTQQLLHLEKQCRELRSRLLRQQRHTLQFKAALDQCLESPGYIGQIKQSLPEPGKPKPSSFVSSNSLIPKVQPIPPWSSQLEHWEYPLGKDWQEDTASSTREEILITSSEETTVEASTELELEQSNLPAELDQPEILLDYIEPELEQRAAAILEQIETQEEITIESETNYPSANWPSPTLYPMRANKKRRDKGSIELPKFAPYQK
jgi:hypothetical protein